jgi:hypothetical protein
MIVCKHTKHIKHSLFDYAKVASHQSCLESIMNSR